MISARIEKQTDPQSKCHDHLFEYQISYQRSKLTSVQQTGQPIDSPNAASLGRHQV